MFPGNGDLPLESAAALGQRLASAGRKLVTVESCTGGLLAAHLTRIPGSSDWFEGAFVTYRLSAKTRMVGVPQVLLDRYGAVSEPTARAMAEGALAACDADMSVAITGVAGPSGGDVDVPVGTVWFAWAVKEPQIRCVQASRVLLPGSRQEVRKEAVEVAVSGLLEILDPSGR